MNLEESIIWLEKEREKLISQGAPEKQIEVYTKFHDWMDELLRWKLCYAEVHREYHLHPKNHFSKKEILDFLDEEFDEWRLEYAEG